MAYIREVKKPDDVKKMRIGDLRNEYNSLADRYLRITKCDDLVCPSCGRLKTAKKENFYADGNTIHGFYPVCKECVFRDAENIEKPIDPPKETKMSVQRVLRKMDKPFIESLYLSCVNSYNNEESNDSGKSKMLPFQRYMSQICSLPAYKGKTWENSEYGEKYSVSRPDKIEIVDEDQEIIKRGRKRFGAYSSEELYQLESAYEDWVSRYPAEAKAQEVLFEQLCIQDMRARKLAKEDGDPKDAIKSCQEIMTSLGIKPTQNSTDAMTDQKSFGELIKAWEMEKPIPEPEGEWADVDRIGLMIDVFFKGHLAKILNIKNAFSSIYENFIGKLTVKRPDLSEDDDTEAVFEELFGNKMTEEFATDDSQ